MPVVDIEIRIVNLSQQERGDRISRRLQLIAVCIPSCSLGIAEVIASRDISIADERELVVPVFEASLQSVLAFNPTDVVEELPPVRDASLGHLIGFPVVRIGNIRTVKGHSGRAARIFDRPDQAQPGNPVLSRRDRACRQHPPVKRNGCVVE